MFLLTVFVWIVSLSAVSMFSSSYFEQQRLEKDFETLVTNCNLIQSATREACSNNDVTCCVLYTFADYCGGVCDFLLPLSTDLSRLDGIITPGSCATIINSASLCLPTDTGEVCQALRLILGICIGKFGDVSPATPPTIPETSSHTISQSISSMTSSVTSPMTSPGTSKTTPPTTSVITSPIASLTTAMAPPVMSPMTRPTTSETTSSATSPITSPVTPVVTSQTPSPLTQPISSPVTSATASERTSSINASPTTSALTSPTTSSVTSSMYPDHWNGLTVTWGRDPTNVNFFVPLPRTVSEALFSGFTKISSDCSNNGKFNGNRYVKNGDYAVVLLYDNKGFIAGQQAGIPSNSPYPSTFIQPPFVAEGDHFFITAYYVDPASICSTGRSSSEFSSQGTGTDLYIQNGTNPSVTIKIPHQQSEMAATKWTEGKCFPSMGIHYWYDLHTDSDCGKMFPVFLLFNRGELNAFGWAFNTQLSSSRYEHPSGGGLGSVMRDAPTCFVALDTVTALHIYLTSNAALNLC